MPDLQSTGVIQRYLVVEEGHGILGYFELPDDECIRDAIRELMEWRYEDDCIVFLRDPTAPSGSDTAHDKAIFAYTIPDSVPLFDHEDHQLNLDYDETADSAGIEGWKEFPRKEAFLRTDVYRREDGFAVIDPFPGNDGEHAIDSSGSAREVTARVAEAYPRLDNESCRLLARLAKKRPGFSEGGGRKKSIAEFFCNLA